jgi:hypothetical protein
MQTKSIFTSWTFWFGIVQILYGGVGLLGGFVDQAQGVTLIFTGLGSIGLRFKTTAPVI